MHDLSPDEMQREHLAECARRILRAVDESAPKKEPDVFDIDLAYESLGRTCAHDVIAATMLVRLLATKLYPNVQSFMDDSSALVARIKLADLT